MKTTPEAKARINRDTTWIDGLGPMDLSTPITAKVPMYSFERPSYMLWREMAYTLMELGWTKKQIIDWLQSKDPRYALDNELGDKVRTIGREWAKRIVKNEKEGRVTHGVPNTSEIRKP